MKKLFFAALFIGLIANIGHAQHYNFKAYTTENGLPQSNVLRHCPG